MLGFLFKLINPLGAVAKSLAEAYSKKQDATTQQAKIAADVEIGALTAKQAVLVAESRTPINSLVRALWVAPMVIYLWVVVVWDKVLEMGATDDLSENLWTVYYIMLAFYFVETISRILKR